jgi:hypothetical protein
MHTFAHVDAQAIYLQLTTERTGRWKTSLDQLQMCASNANVMSLSKWSSSSVSITAWVERFSWQLFGPGCSAFSLLFREAHLFLLGPIISRAPLMVLLRVTKCTVCGDDGTDGWGLARAYWGLSRKGGFPYDLVGPRFWRLFYCWSIGRGLYARETPVSSRFARSVRGSRVGSVESRGIVEIG